MQSILTKIVNLQWCYYQYGYFFCFTVHASWPNGVLAGQWLPKKQLNSNKIGQITQNTRYCSMLGLNLAEEIKSKQKRSDSEYCQLLTVKFPAQSIHHKYHISAKINFTLTPEWSLDQMGARGGKFLFRFGFPRVGQGGLSCVWTFLSCKLHLIKVSKIEFLAADTRNRTHDPLSLEMMP